MNHPLHADLWRALKTVMHPLHLKDIVSLQLVQSLQEKENIVTLVLEFPLEEMKWSTVIEQHVKEALASLPGVEKVQVGITTHRAARKAPAFMAPEALPGVPSIIAIASGKGGVGKSTTSLNLALALSSFSLKIGLLDADIYGPSLPHLLKLFEKPVSPDGQKMEPLEKYGLKCMSMGFLMPAEKAAIWRGPMIHSAVQQMLRQVNWGKLDLLLIDMPPGTGDVALSLTQSVPLRGAIMVSTPQDLALLDVRRAMEMFEKVKIPVLGMIENMSYFVCPACQHASDIFHRHGVRQEAENRGLPFLGEIPLHIGIREACDAGIPLLIEKPESPEAASYFQIAKTLWERLKIH